MMRFAQIDPTEVVSEATRYSWEAGLLCLVIVALGIASWRITWYVIHRVFGDETKGSRGLAGEFVDGQKVWQTELTRQLATQTERLEQQTVACTAHVVTVQTMGESLARQIAAAQLAQDAAQTAQEAARFAAEQMVEGNRSLAKIDETLMGRTEMLQDTALGVKQLKGCLFHLCDVCQNVVGREFPNSMADVSGYLLAIKKTINDDKA
jgi:hypothetical protein